MGRRRSMLSRVLFAAGAVALGLVTLGAGLGCCVLSAPRHKGPPSDHFDGERFRNPLPPATPRTKSVAGWLLTRHPGPWPEEMIDAKSGPPPLRAVDGGRMRVTFVNHATVLLQMDGRNILTDPIWSERASPFSFVGPQRVRPPGIRFEDLPKIDVVLLSHNHYDHMDIATLTRLRDAFHPRFVVGLGNELFLAEHGIDDVTALDWDQSVDVGGLHITSAPSQHFSNRGLCDADGTLWTAFVIEGKTAGRAYFAGDTGYGPHFADTARHFPGLRLAVLPIGAYVPVDFMGVVHMTPAQAVQAQEDLGARTAVAIHFNTFPLADDAYDQAPRDLLTALDHEEHAPDFRVLGFGEALDVDPLSP